MGRKSPVREGPIKTWLRNNKLTLMPVPDLAVPATVTMNKQDTRLNHD